MTDKPRDEERPDTGYEPASSPYDQPTEKLQPRTEDELDFGKSGSGSYPTEQIPSSFRPSRFDEPIAPDSSSTAYSDKPTEFLPTTPASASYGTGSSDRFAADQNAPEPVVRTETVEIPARRGTTDLGLLLLRLVVGAIFLVHGLQKLTGMWNGPGLDGFRSLLEETGYDRADILAIAGAVGETAGGALLILGLATPFAGAAVLSVIINAWLFKQAAEPGLQFFAPTGVEYETVLGVAAAAIILTGPGKIAFDGRRGWATRPRFGSFIALILGIAAGVCLWIFLNGANPLAT
ncbi:DoxX family protein [Rhodococcoides fascians]|uniref:DoxX family protein n=1 Tax=Rhodococcoides fascians TaxID=1828 RepID=UPI00055E9C62|nr:MULTISPECIES: DoxX family protein [Rhodococcus]OZE94816.1 DoxX family protein [Rhodococcus sp. 15-1189-1-1a]OZF09127.1 DoxX family protein [Rhodococcus sp. 14-2686-1-2]